MASSLNSVIGALRANLSLDSAQFKKGLTDAQAKLKGFGANASKFGSKIGTSLVAAFAKFRNVLVAVVAAIGAVFAAIAAGTVKVANNAREIERTSKALGMTAQSYQAMTKAADKFGLSQENVSDIIKDSNEKLGEYIATGGGEMKDFIEQVANPQGVSAEDLLKLPPEDRLIKMQSLMEAQNLTLEEQIFYWESIANDASKLRLILANGGAEFEKIKQLAIETGSILSDEVVANLSSFDKSLDSIGSTMSGWGNLLVSGFSGPLAELTGKLATVLQNAQWIRDVFSAIGSGIGVAISSISYAFDYVYASLSNVNSEGSRFYDLGQSLGVIWEYLGGVFQRVWMLVSGGIQIAWSYLQVMISAWTAMADVATYALAAVLGPLNTVSDEMNNGLGEAIGWVVQRFADMASDAAYTFELTAAYGKGAVDAIKAAFQVLPGALGDLMYSAAKNVVDAVEKMINEIVVKMNKIITVANNLGSRVGLSPFELLGEVTLDVANPYKGQATAAGKAVGDAFMAHVNKVQRRTYEPTPAAAAPEGTGNEIPPLGPFSPNRTTPGGGGGGGGKGKGGGAGGGKEKLTDEQREAEREAKKQEEAYKSLRERVASLKDTLGMTALQQEIYNEQKKIGTAAAPEAVAALVQEEDRLKKFAAAMEEAKDMFVGAFKDIITGAKSAKEVLADVLTDMAGRLAEMAANHMWQSMIGPMFGNFGQAAMSAIPFFANGTSGSGAGLALAGEFGPEIVNLRPGTKIRKNTETNKILNDMSGGGGASTVHISLSEGLEASILAKAENQSINISTSATNQMRKSLPSEMRKIQRDGRKA